jgi:DNA replication protein
MEELLYRLLTGGTLSLPALLLRHYKEIGLTDQEMMLVLHIIDFKKDRNDFPTIQELKARMSADEKQVILMLQKLLQSGMLAIEDVIEPETGIRAELMLLEPLYKRLVSFLLSQETSCPSAEEEMPSVELEQNLYTVFEQEFGRPLSPIECETLSMWQDNDHYSDELIIAALREAVISGKLYFRYIDRILFEWQRNNIRTPKQAREFSLKFRKPYQAQAQKKAEPFPFFNWLEQETN